MLKRQAEYHELMHYKIEGMIQLLLQFRNEQELNDAVDYLCKNLSFLYIQYKEIDGKEYLVYDPNENIQPQIFYHNAPMGCEFSQYRKHYKLHDNKRCGELHIFNDNILVILGQHSITDGRLITDLVYQIRDKVQQKITLPDTEYDIFEKEFAEFKQKLSENYYTTKYQNNFDLVDELQQQPIHVEIVKININKQPQLQHRLSQKLILINSLYKLYVLQKQGKLNNISELLKNGLAIMQTYIADGRKYVKDKKPVFGCCALCFYENYLLKSDKTVKEYVQEFQQSMKEMDERKEQYRFLKEFEDTMNNVKQEPNYKVINSYNFSNVGHSETDYYKDVQMDFYNHFQTVNFVGSFLYSFNGILSMCYQCPEEFKNHKLTKIVTLLMENIYDDKTVGQLWDLIKDQ